MEDIASADRISSLPDDLLHLVLLRLGCARDAARASVLSRRWPRVCSGLPKPELDVTLHHIPLDWLEDALRRAAGPGVRLLDIRVALGPQDGTRARFVPPVVPLDGSRPRFIPPVLPQDGSMPPFVAPIGPQDRWRPRYDAGTNFSTKNVVGTSLSAVLRAAAALAPMELRFMVAQTRAPFLVGLPRFLRATSMELHGLDLRLHLQPSQAGAGFPLLERLTLSGCNVDLGLLIPNCPRLQVLTVDDFTVRSTSLQELLVNRMKAVRGRAEACALRQFTALSSFLDGVEYSWSCSYPKVTHGLGLWGLLELGLKTSKRQGEEVLSLYMCAQDSLSFQDQERGFAAEIGKHVVTQFSALNLHLTTKGHAFGAFVLRLLGMHRLKDIHNFNIDVSRSENTPVRKDSPASGRSLPSGQPQMLSGRCPHGPSSSPVVALAGPSPSLAILVAGCSIKWRDGVARSQ
ncbi:uncharacterized protein [Aegilops tauschii subsp. strangulata]|uniref:uncharacterized protein n=1 Tax=Aegilops tauschii subsp. strangulata TaxID=200361 RepID=UPI003CC8DFBB